VSGAFRHDLEQLFGASAIDGQLGHHVLTPMLRGDGAAVLVDRGWVPADKAHPAARRESQIGGPVEVTGIARYRADGEPGWFTPDNQPQARLWFRYDLPALEEALGLELLPVVVEADASANAGDLPIGGRTRVELPNNHLQYALTWYGLATVLVAMYLGFGMQRQEKGR
jgi:surfeit locus 1 family protein